MCSVCTECRGELQTVSPTWHILSYTCNSPCFCSLLLGGPVTTAIVVWWRIPTDLPELRLGLLAVFWSSGAAFVTEAQTSDGNLVFQINFKGTYRSRSRCWSSVRTTASLRLQVHSVAWNCDGSRLASGSFDKTVTIWTLESDRLVRLLIVISAGYVWLEYIAFPLVRLIRAFPGVGFSTVLPFSLPICLPFSPLPLSPSHSFSLLPPLSPLPLLSSPPPPPLLLLLPSLHCPTYPGQGR